MATKLKSSRVTLRAFPAARVQTDSEPYNDDPDLAQDATNVYVPDPQGKSSFFSRPGFSLKYSGASVLTGRGQAIYTHAALDGTTTLFLVAGGHIYRVDAAQSIIADVTPISGVVVDGSVGTRVSFVSLIGTLVVNDSVNPPWVVDDPSATPLTGTYIDYDGTGVSWSARAGTLYKGAIFYPLIQVNGVNRQTDLSWCNPGTPTIGWQQPDYDNNWTVETSSSGVIYAVRGTNTTLYYWRELSIGTIDGEVGPSLASTATEDAIGFNVGAQASQSIQEFGNSFFFCDAIGRPNLFRPGTPPPTPIWHQMRQIVDEQSVASPATTAINVTTALEPTLNLYLAAIWSAGTSTEIPPTEIYAFDGLTGSYAGRWTVGDTGSGGVPIECIGVLIDSSGRAQLVVIAQGGYVWSMNVLSSTYDAISTEAASPVILTTEGTAPSVVVSESLPAVWHDNGIIPNISVTTSRLGYDEDRLVHVDMATIITLTNDPCSVTLSSTMGLNVVQGTPTPATSFDNTNRLVVGCDILGRGAQVTVKPTSLAGQWSLQRVTLKASMQNAGPMDA